MQLTGSQILIEELKRHKVSEIFGYPGGSILSVYDALYADGKINCVNAVDERGAVFMADGYARASGKTSVCMATSGPGATNLVTGIAAAFIDSVPMVIITGNVSLETLGHDSFQEVDTTGVTMPITKYNYIVKNIDDLAPAVAEAFALADSGRKGPVLIDIPFNLFDEKCKYVVPKTEAVKPNRFNPEDIARAAEIINAAKKPLIYAGGGVAASGTETLAVALSEKLNAPIGVSLMGIGNVPANFKNYIGVGTSINRLAKDALAECDVFISLGARFSNKASEKSLYNKNVKLVHLDIDNAEIGKIHEAEGAVCGDLADTLPAVIKAVNAKSNEWLNSVLDKKCSDTTALSVHKQYIKCLNNFFGNDMTVTTDVGQHQLWVANYYNFDKPRRFLSSCGLGAMGYGLGAAIGAHFATGKPVLMITGDGSFNMNFNELLTVKSYNVPVVIVIMNNQSLGMIREEQRKFYHSRFIACDLACGVDYAMLTRAFNVPAYVAKTPAELEKLLPALPKNTAAVIDCRVPKTEKSF